MSNRSRVIICLAIVLLIVAIASPVFISHFRKAPAFTIGVIGPLTGNASAYGDWVRAGIDAALEDRSTSSPEVRVIYEDDRGDPKTAVTAFYRLRDVEKADAVISVLTAPTLAIRQLAEESRIPVITPVASHPDVTKGSTVMFRNSLSSRQEAEAILAYIKEQHRDLSKIAVLYINDAGGVASNEAFRGLAGERATASFPFAKGSLDFANTVSGALISAPDSEAFYITGYGKEIGAVLRDLRARGFKGLVFANQGIENDEAIRIAGPAAEGTIYTFYAKPESIPAAFARRDAPISPATFAAFEAFQILVAANQNSKSTGRSLVDILHSDEFTGLYGPIKFSADGDTTRPIAIKRINESLEAQFIKTIHVK